MIYVTIGVLSRIISNSYINVFQKILTGSGNRPSCVNFYMYLGLFILCLLFIPYIFINYTNELIINFLAMGILGALGNYFIIKALSIGELSSLAPINSYKPIVAMIIAFFYLNEIPSLCSILGIFLIIIGTYILHYKKQSNLQAVLYRVTALIFSGTEAVFIKKIILITNVPTSFVLWAISGLIFASIGLFMSKIKPNVPQFKTLLLLILSVTIMQYSTNYVFSKMNVSYALALFQLSTLLSIFLGVNIFKEKGLIKKLIASLIMIVGAIVIILT